MKRALLLVLLMVFAVHLPPASAGGDEDREFRRRVDAAITAGCEHLLRTQQPDGTWQSPYDEKWPGGATALACLALLVSEINPWRDEMQKTLQWIESRKFERTYSAAIAMMAIEACHIPPDEFKAMREDRPVEKPVRKVTPQRKAFLEWHVKMLLGGRQHDAWGYPAGPDSTSDWGGDLSNLQYALLGLKSASRCGIEIEDDAWFKVLKILLTAQEKEGPKVRLIVSKSVDKHGYETAETRPAEVRGWRYRWPYSVKVGSSASVVNPGPDDKPSGSMTTAGIACLAIIHSELLRSPKYQREIRDVSQAIHDGFAWLAANWAVDKNPGGNPVWHYYYLYGLERAGVLGGRKWIGEHDWYREGAEYLLARQLPGGGFGDGLLDTCFALLFLRRSTVPVATTGLSK
ncbi:MAG: hypothetical protein MUE73_00580 [Planctomycetes bacterium]|nr:hypothetical protein [Planctomycetota bacterium]